MRILVLSAASNIHTVRWVNKYIDYGHDVHLAYLPEHKPAKHKISEKVVLHELSYGGMKGYYLNRKKIRDIVKEYPFDIIHAHYASGYGTLLRMSQVHPSVLSVWGSDVYDFPNGAGYKKRMLKRNLKAADYVTSTSFCMKKETLKYTDKAIKVVPFGVDLTLFKKEEVQKADQKFVVGTVKTLEPNYGIDDGIKSFKYLYDSVTPEEAQHLTYKIYGTGSSEQELKDLISQLQLQQHVFLMGGIPNVEVPKAMAEFDTLLLTSHGESFGVAVVEGMACEIPVIASDVEGFAEVLENGTYGTLVEPKNINAFGEALVSMYHEGKNQELLCQARKKVENDYDWDANVKDMLAFFEEIIIHKSR